MRAEKLVLLELAWRQPSDVGRGHGTAARPWPSRSQGLRWLYEAHQTAQTDGQTPGTAAERERQVTSWAEQAEIYPPTIERLLHGLRAPTFSNPAPVHSFGHWSNWAFVVFYASTGHTSKLFWVAWPGSCYCCLVGRSSTFSAHRVQQRANKRMLLHCFRNDIFVNR